MYICYNMIIHHWISLSGSAGDVARSSVAAGIAGAAVGFSSARASGTSLRGAAGPASTGGAASLQDVLSIFK